MSSATIRAMPGGKDRILSERMPAAWERSDGVIAMLLFVVLSTIYFATASGITSSNDGSHYALARTMIANGEFALRQFDDYAEGNDIAIREEVLYSDRPPGTALATAVFYLAGGLGPTLPAPLPSRHDAENPRLAYVLLLPVWVGAGTAVLLYRFLRDLRVSQAGAITAVLVFGLGTIQWKYSSVLYSHALSGFLVLLSVWLAWRLAREQGRVKLPSRHRYAILGFLLGGAVLVEYSNGLLVLLVGLYLLAAIRPFTRRRIVAMVGPFIAGGLGPAAFLAVYNSVNFGGPFTLSYAYAVNYPWAGDLTTTFSIPLGQGLRTMLIWGTGGGWCDPTCYNQGLFLLSPVLLLALPGLYFYWRRARSAFLLTTSVFVVYLLLFSMHFTAHGFTADGRYLTPFFSLLVIPFGFIMHWLWRHARHPLWQMAGFLLAYGLFFLSWRNIFFHIGFSYNYGLAWQQLSAYVASPQNWRYLAGELFRNTVNLPLLWGIEGVGIALWLTASALWRLARRDVRPV